MLIALASVAAGMGFSAERSWELAEQASRQSDEKAAFFEMHRLVGAELAAQSF